MGIPYRPRNSDTPPGNFVMLSRLNKLDLCELFFTEWQPDLDHFSVKKVHTSPARLVVRAFQSCQGGVTICGSLLGLLGNNLVIKLGLKLDTYKISIRNSKFIFIEKLHKIIKWNFFIENYYVGKYGWLFWKCKIPKEHADLFLSDHVQSVSQYMERNENFLQ